MKKITFFNLATFLVLLFVTTIGYSQFDSDHPDLRLPEYGFNCTSNNVSVENVYLSATTANGTP